MATAQQLLALVRRLANRMEVEPATTDPRAALWEIARARATHAAPAKRLMPIACWLWFVKGKRDLGLVNRALGMVAGAKNPYAYLQLGGKALEGLVGKLAVERAEAKQATIQADEQRLGYGRRERGEK